MSLSTKKVINIENIDINEKIKHINTKLEEYDNIKDILLDDILLDNIILYHLGKAGIGGKEDRGFSIDYINKLKNFIKHDIDNVVKKTKEFLIIDNNKKELQIKEMMNTITNDLFLLYLLKEKLEIEEIISTYYLISEKDLDIKIKILAKTKIWRGG